MVSQAPAPMRSNRTDFAHCILHDLRTIRTMPSTDDQPPLINWGVVVTNAVGMMLGLIITAGSTALLYLVYRLPAAQTETLNTLQEMRKTQVRMEEHMDKLQVSDRAQDDRLLRLEQR